MSKVIDRIIDKAKSLQKTIVLAEGEEPRTVKAAEIITKNKIAKIILLGNEDSIKSKYPEVNFDGITILDPLKQDTSDYANTLYELRKAKGMTEEQAKSEIVKTSAGGYLNYGAMMIKKGDADGMVAGAVNSTGNVLRSGLTIVKTKPGIKTVSSVFLMAFEGTPFKDSSGKKFEVVIVWKLDRFARNKYDSAHYCVFHHEDFDQWQFIAGCGEDNESPIHIFSCYQI